MKTILVVLVMVLSVAHMAGAQTVVSGPSLLVWDQPAVGGVPVLPSAFSFTAKVDTATPVPLTATCTAPVAPAVDWLCKAPMPDMTEGSHTVVVVASAVISDSTRTAESEPISIIKLTILIQPPKNVRIEAAPPGGGL